MSVDIDWKTLTEGPDGLALAETIRDFIHERFQQIPFPKLIRSVQVHAFDFGTIAPEVVLKDICEPLPDFYETDELDSSTSHGEHDDDAHLPTQAESSNPAKTVKGAAEVLREARENLPVRAGSPLGRGPAPGVFGPTTTNLGYFHLPLSAGLSGTATPLAAVAGAQFQHGHQSPPLDHPPPSSHHHHSDSFSGSVSSAQPDTEDGFFDGNKAPSAVIDDDDAGTETFVGDLPPDRSPEDLQVVFHATYAGDIQLSLTAEVFLDYPMPSFVGIPLKLNITGLTFDGVGIVAYIKKRAHLCFLSPEDAHALIGDPFDAEAGADESESTKTNNRVGTLLEQIKIETEMGETDSSKPVLKNVGKIEKFVLEQVRRIFEEEFVYPSFWTFLV